MAWTRRRSVVAGVVIGVSMRKHHGAKIAWIDPEQIHVVDCCIAAEAGVIQDGVALTVVPNSQHQRVAVLGS